MTRRLTLAAAVLTMLSLSFIVSPAQAKETITYAYLLDPAQEGILYAIRAGIVTSDAIEIDARPLAIPALIQSTPTKQYDVLMNAVMAIPLARRRGLDLVVLSTGITAAPGRKGGGLWVKKDSAYHAVADLKGKTVGNYALKSTGTTWARIALTRTHGINASYENGDFEWVQLPAPSLPAALESGRIDAATLIHSQAFKAERSGDFRALNHTAEDIHAQFGVNTVSAVLVSYPEKLAERPDAFKEFNRMLKASVDYAVANPDAVGAEIAKQGKISAEYFKVWLADYSRTPGVISSDHLEAMETVWMNAEMLGLLEAGEAPKAESVIWEHAIRAN
ncbi:MAG: ABC transporter substrate-binding protein [Gammaproteobacteria bacterium]